MKQLLISLVAGAFVLASGTVEAQQKSQRIRGTISAFDGKMLSVKSREGKDLVVELTGKASVATAKAITLADLKPGAYVGVTTRKGADGALVALEVHTLPPAVKPGFRPWDLAPGTMMTNANIASVTQGAGGHELVMKLPDGEQKIRVPSGTPIVTQVKAGRSDLKTGEYVFFNANVGADGKLTVPGRIQVSKGGVKPPQ
ncbi:MAG TPA: hypothetical protein VH881_13875 [Burkholderiales bacterium]|jgi:hypothetical protein